MKDRIVRRVTENNVTELEKIGGYVYSGEDEGYSFVTDINSSDISSFIYLKDMIFVSGDILEGTELLETIHKANVSNFYNIYDLIKDLVDKNIITVDEDELICGKGINGFIYETDGLTEDVIADAISSMYGSILYSNDADRLESTMQMFEFLSNYAENELLDNILDDKDRCEKGMDELADIDLY